MGFYGEFPPEAMLRELSKIPGLSMLLHRPQSAALRFHKWRPGSPSA
jgi:hypothetical protein